MLKNLRINIIRSLVEMNEKIFFNRKLLNFYIKKIGNNVHLILDVGANTGQSIDIFQKLNSNCQIMAFEPNPTLFEKLQKKYLEKDNISLFQLGISDEVGEKTFYENIFHTTSTFEELDYKSKYLKKKSSILGVKPEHIVKNTYTVKVSTLSDFINNHCHQQIDILKIDTEGHEYSCLLGLFDKPIKFDVKYIQLETHYDDMYLQSKKFEDISSILEENDFKIIKKIKHGFGDFEDVIFEKMM